MTAMTIRASSHARSGNAASPAGVLALVPDSYSGPWQPRHQVLRRLAAHFPVVWVTPAHDWRRGVLHLRRRPVSRQQVCPRLVVYTPEPWLPRLYRPRRLATRLERARLERARQVLAELGCRRVILYVWRPEYASSLELLPHDLSCYHIDDEYSFSTADTPVSEHERALICAVDQVFVHSRALFEKKGRLNPHTALVPNGVDFKAYATPRAEPKDLAGLPRPLVGYSGILKRQLDWPLISHLVRKHPHWSFVFVGPTGSHAEVRDWINELSRTNNVHFLGGKSPDELPAYPQHFDVCLMPYRLDGYTKYIYPLKLHEYLASGRPVVGSPIPALHEFREVVALAATPEEWADAIATALRDGREGDAARRRQEVARAFDWDILVARIAATLAGRLGLEPPPAAPAAPAGPPR